MQSTFALALFAIIGFAAARSLPHLDEQQLRVRSLFRPTEDESVANLIAFGVGKVSNELRNQLTYANSSLGSELKSALLRLNSRFASFPLEYGTGLDIALGLSYLENVKILNAQLEERTVSIDVSMRNVSPGPAVTSSTAAPSTAAPSTTVELTSSTAFEESSTPAPATEAILSSSISSVLPTEVTKKPEIGVTKDPLSNYKVEVPYLVQSLKLLRLPENSDIRSVFLKVLQNGGLLEDQRELAFLLIRNGVKSLEALD